MESQSEILNDLMKVREKYEKEMPGVASAIEQVRLEAYKDGALSPKVKRLIALGIALRAGCIGCILAQTKLSVDAGASKGEVLEATSVAVALSGTTGFAESFRVIKLLDELGVK
jgi:AhpD family alkylhydroperoxidase